MGSPSAENEISTPPDAVCVHLTQSVVTPAFNGVGARSGKVATDKSVTVGMRADDIGRYRDGGAGALRVSESQPDPPQPARRVDPVSEYDVILVAAARVMRSTLPTGNPGSAAGPRLPASESAAR